VKLRRWLSGRKNKHPHCSPTIYQPSQRQAPLRNEWSIICPTCTERLCDTEANLELHKQDCSA